MKVRFAIAACIAISAVTAAIPSLSQSAEPPIAPNYDIYSISVNGGTPRRLTTDQVDEVSPSMSRNGATIVYSRGRDLWLMDTDGRNQRLLAAAPEQVSYEEPSWSATGRYVAFTQWDVSGCIGVPYHCAVPSVAVIRADGSGLRRIRARAMGPRWSLRGERLLFAGDVVPYDIEPTSIYAVALDGAGPKLAYARHYMSGHSWSPDGSRVAYARGGTNAGVFIVRANGTGRRRLTEGTRPEWSPAGGRIALQVEGRLYVVKARGRTRSKRLAFANWYSWNRQGTRLALVDWKLAVIRPDGRAFRVLCCEDRFGFAEGPPAWSRTGDQLFYSYKPPSLPP